MIEELPAGWESGGPGEAVGNGPGRTFTHWYANHDPESVDQPRESTEKRILELQVYHDSGNSQYHVVLEESRQFLNSDGETEETVQESIRRQQAIEVREDEDDWISPSNKEASSHEEAEEMAFDIARQLMEQHN